MYRVLHVISGLKTGGAEKTLHRLIVETRHSGWSHIVIALTPAGDMGQRLREDRIDLIVFDFKRAPLSEFLRLLSLMRKSRPDVVQTWMYHADLIGGLAAKLSGTRAIAWGIRHSNLPHDKTRVSVRIVARFCAWLSPWVPAAIVSCSEEAARVHKRLGYRGEKFVVIPNGFDLSRFAPNERARGSLREEWGIGEGQQLVGFVARWDPQKDHPNLLAALAQVARSRPDLRCALVGRGMDTGNEALSELVKMRGLQRNVILAGPREDVPTVMNALDLHVLSSMSEAFPNTVAEAMACGTPCVVTGVGDAALIVGDAGWVVPPRNPIALGDAIETALVRIARDGRDTVAHRCRQRIEENFSLERMANAYVGLWESVSDHGLASRSRKASA